MGSDRALGSVGVDFRANGACGEPSTYGTRNREARSNTHQKRGISAKCGNSGDLSTEVSVALSTESDLGRISHGLRVGAWVAHQRARDRRDRAGCAARVATIEHQAVHLKARLATG